MFRAWIALLLLLCLGGCSGPGVGLGFVVNRTTGAAEAQGKAKSYAISHAELSQVGDALLLRAEENSLRVVLAIPCVEKDPKQLLGRTVPLIKEGSSLRIEGIDHAITEGQASFQSSGKGAYRGNFNVRFGEGLEAVGFFEATGP